MCWITFSAGAELLLKGVCLAHEVEVGHRPDSFGTLDGAVKQLGHVFEKIPVSKEDQSRVRKTYATLKKIRDRDVHAYWPNVRNNDFTLVGEVFVPCLNAMLSWVQDRVPMSDTELEKFFNR